jgi:peptidoglycan LD-endopeptidase CwlK
MATFSKTSENKLALAHPDLAILFYWVIKYYDCTIADSYRTKAKQEEYFNQGLSKVHYPTCHNTRPSNAVDAYPFEVTRIDYDLAQCLHFAGFVMGIANMLYDKGIITHKIRNGGDWDKDNDINDNPFEDPGHFEIIPNAGETFQYFEV